MNKLKILLTAIYCLVFGIGSEVQCSEDDIHTRTECVRKQLETMKYLNRQFSASYTTLSEAIQQIDNGNNVGKWTTDQIAQFKIINTQANKAKHDWIQEGRTQEDFDIMEKKFLSQKETGQSWNQELVDYWEISQELRDQANIQFQKDNPQFFTSSSDDNW